MRARPLPPEERRATIIAAARPLILRSGPSVSTRDVAEAAGIAEGTLFRVFATKDALVDAVLDDLMDPTTACAAIRRIHPELDLEVRIEQVIEILSERIRQVTGFFVAMRFAPRDHTPAKEAEIKARQAEHSRMVDDAIAHALGEDGHRLRIPVRQAAHLIRSMTFVTGHPMISADLDLGPRATVEILLHGLLTDSAVSPPLTLAPSLDPVEAR